MFESLKIWEWYGNPGGGFKYSVCSSRKLGKWSKIDCRIFFQMGGSTTNLLQMITPPNHQHSTLKIWLFFFSRLLRWVPLTIQGFHDAWGTSLESPWTILTFLAPQDRGQDPPWAENATSGAAMAVVLCVFFFRPGEEDIYIDIFLEFS